MLTSTLFDRRQGIVGGHVHVPHTGLRVDGDGGGGLPGGVHGNVGRSVFRPAFPGICNTARQSDSTCALILTDLVSLLQNVQHSQTTRAILLTTHRAIILTTHRAIILTTLTMPSSSIILTTLTMPSSSPHHHPHHTHHATILTTLTMPPSSQIQ